MNTKILVIDDEESIRDSFLDILSPKKSDTSTLDQASAALFGGSNGPVAATKPNASLFDLQVDQAANGKAGVELVAKSLADGEPYAAIFCDMRMPGWDGLTTVQHIRELDERSEIIFVTAYSDHNIDDIVSRAGANVSYFCKPFAPEEIRQIATKAVFDWNKSRGLEGLIKVIANLRTEGDQLEKLLHNILVQVSELIGTQSSMIARQGENGDLERILAIGTLSQDNVSKHCIDSISNADEVVTTEDFAFFPVSKYGIIALFESDGSTLNSERYYMVKLFLEQAGQAIENANLQEQLMQNEKLSAVGQAIGMVSHDLRGPLGGISSAADLAKDFLEEGDKTSLGEMLWCIGESCKLTQNLVQDVIDYSQGKNGVVSELTVASLMETVNQLISDFVEEHSVAFETDVDPNIIMKGEERKLARIIYNLTKNAIEALHPLDLPGKRVLVRIKGNENKVDFEISDNGPGIPEDLKSKLFTPFATKGKQGGTGLGLAIVKNFVEAHGGEISVDSSVSGTTFSFQLDRD